MFAKFFTLVLRCFLFLESALRLSSRVGRGIGGGLEHLASELLELLSVLPPTAYEEHEEIRRSIVLLFRLMCYEVRADVQARENRATWLDPDGGVCTPAERSSFFAVQQQLRDNKVEAEEWPYHHPQKP